MPQADRTAENQADFELMRRIADGDADALSLLYDRYCGLVLALGVRMLRDRGEAEDFLIDVFWEVWDRADRFDPSRGAPITYLMTLARSRAIDRQRSAATRGKSLEVSDVALAGEASSNNLTPADDAQTGERGIIVRSALKQLDPPQQQAVEMAFFEGLSHSEIASKLNRPLGSVKTNIRQGLIRLRELLRNT